MILEFIAAFIIPLTLSLLLTPRVIRLAHQIGAIDQPNERKAHKNPMPRLGGVAVFVSFACSMAFLLSLHHLFPFPAWATSGRGIMLAAALTLVVALGIWDDLRTLRPSQKFVVQLVLSTVVYLAGFRISGITHPFSAGLLNLGLLNYVVTVLWIVGVTNAINLIDGLDGLASGVASIAALTMAPIAILNDDIGTALIALVLAGSVLGFLRYNFNPAKIFLGDSGSLFLGFMLAVLSTQSSTKSSTAFSILVPVLALGLPIMDTLLSMIRRLLRSFLHDEANAKSLHGVLASLFHPDRGHIHHQLLARGFSHRRVVLTLYVVSCTLGIGAFAITVTNNVATSLVLVVVGTAMLLGVRQLRYREMAILSNGVFLPLFDNDLLNRNLFQVFLDIAFILFAYVIAYLIMDWTLLTTPVSHDFVLTLAVVCCVQFVTFWVRGTYRGTFRQFGLADALRITKAAVFAVIISGIVLAFIPRPAFKFDLAILILDFYFLLSMALGSRISFRVLNHLFQKEPRGGKRVLIYGADHHGVFLLQRILEATPRRFTPTGFLDDSPDLEGKHLNGYPVFGGHWKLERVARKHGVEEVLLSSDDIKPEIFRRITARARTLGLAVRRFNTRLEELSSGAVPSPDRTPAVAPTTPIAAAPASIVH